MRLHIRHTAISVSGFGIVECMIGELKHGLDVDLVDELPLFETESHVGPDFRELILIKKRYYDRQ